MPIADIREISVEELFNLPLSEPHTVIHVSDADDFHKMHLVTATHLCETSPNPDALAQLLETIGMDFCPEVLDTIVLSGTHPDSVARILQEWASNCANPQDPAEGETAQNYPTTVFCKQLLARCSAIRIFPSSGLPDIAASFPFLVESGPGSLALPPIMPAQITRNLFLGSQTHASNPLVFEVLGVAAVANISNEVPSFYADSDEVKAEYLRCAVDDEDGQDMTGAFESSYEFIQQHISKGHKVLVHCSRGVSRSVSVVLHYLLRSGTFTNFTSALEHVQRCRKGAKPNRGFTQQLLLRFSAEPEEVSPT